MYGGAQRQQGALAVIDEAVEDARVPALFLDEVLDAGQSQALDGLLDALGDRRGRPGDDRENQERHGGTSRIGEAGDTCRGRIIGWPGRSGGACAGGRT